jgi:hypothetical protein
MFIVACFCYTNVPRLSDYQHQRHRRVMAGTFLANYECLQARPTNDVRQKHYIGRMGRGVCVCGGGRGEERFRRMLPHLEAASSQSRPSFGVPK